MRIDPQMTVDQVLERHPQAARVFVDRRMACVGCPIAAFETVEEVARAYGEDPDTLLAALRACASRHSGRGGRRVGKEPPWASS
ncbi:MAG TPA: DUF1858 domain-containing protein [Phycisphaeraceae bacterium]